LLVGIVHWWPAPVSVGGLLVGGCPFVVVMASDFGDIALDWRQ